MNYVSPNVGQKLKSFVRWMTHEDRPYELHDDFLATLTRDNYLKFRHMDSQSFSASSPSHHEHYKLKTSFSGESKHQTLSKSTPVSEGVVATRRTSGQTVSPRVCSYVLVMLEVSLARN